MLSEMSPLSRFALRFHRACAWSWKEFYFRHHFDDKALDVHAMYVPVKDEIQKELQWAAARPSSRAQDPVPGGKETTDAKAKAQALAGPEPMAGFVFDFAGDPLVFHKCLNNTELRFLQGYKLQHPNQCWQLNQNPGSGHGASSTGRCMITLIRNSHLIYSDAVSPERWLLGSEALAAQGFPVHPGLHTTEPCFGCINLNENHNIMFNHVEVVMSCASREES